MSGLLARVEGKSPRDMAAKVQAGLRATSEKDAMVARVMDHVPRRRSGLRPFLALAAAAVIVLALYAILRAPEPTPAPPVVPTARTVPPPVIAPEVRAAIAKAVDYLRRAPLPSATHQTPAPSDELVLWAFVNAGVPKEDPLFDKLLQKVLSTKLQRTYSVSLQAMVLERLDAAKYRGRIADCAQFLVDNQCINGQWSY